MSSSTPPPHPKADQTNALPKKKQTKRENSASKSEQTITVHKQTKERRKAPVNLCLQGDGHRCNDCCDWADYYSRIPLLNRNQWKLSKIFYKFCRAPSSGSNKSVKLKCPVTNCRGDRVFGNMAALSSHALNVHQVGYLYSTFGPKICFKEDFVTRSVCFYATTTSSNLMRHQKRNKCLAHVSPAGLPEHLSGCEICGKKSKSSKLLIVHKEKCHKVNYVKIY